MALHFIDDNLLREFGLKIGITSMCDAFVMSGEDLNAVLAAQPENEFIANLREQMADSVLLPRTDATELFRLYVACNQVYGTGARYGWRQWEALEAVMPHYRDGLPYRKSLIRLLCEYIAEAQAAKTPLTEAEFAFVQKWHAFARGEAEMPRHKLVSADFLSALLAKFEHADYLAAQFTGPDEEAEALVQQLKELVG